MNFLGVFKILLFSVLILFSIELLSFLYLKKHHRSCKLVYQKASKNSYENKLKLYNVLDPLLGWSINYDAIESKYFTTKNNSIYFENISSSCNKPFKIYISGGSTSDLTFDKKNWPFFLVDLMMQQKICFELYLAAVGGYNSGQELLKIVRDVDEINPDLHISYSGANEVEDAGLVSNYEYTLFENLLHPSISGWLPNIRTLINLKRKDIKVTLKPKNQSLPSDFWQRNVEKMNAIAIYNNYEFIGVLQPVLLHSNQISADQKEKYHQVLKDFNLFYLNTKYFSKEVDNILDFTTIFQNIDENPFLDDCHLKDIKYQKMVADSIFTLIEPLLINAQDSISKQD